MACKYNIKVVEHNDFTMLFPLKKRTYVASLPIDEDIVIMDLEDVKVTIGGVEFASTLDERGVMVAVAYDALERGTYDIIITAEYHGAQIRAAYFEGLTIVNWNMQSDAEQYLPGSPIVMQAAFVIGGPLTDAELEQLKQQYREAIAAAQQAQADAEAAKREWEEKAADLDGVAQEQTLTQGVQDIREDISHIDIDTTTLAKQGTNPNATNTAILEAVQSGSSPADALENEVETGKAAIAAAIIAKGGRANASMSLAQLAQAIDSTELPTGMDLSTLTFYSNINNTLYDMGGVATLRQGTFSIGLGTYVKEVRNFPNTPFLTEFRNAFRQLASLEKVDFTGIDTSRVQNLDGFLYNNPSLVWADCTSISAVSCTAMQYPISANGNLQTIVGDRTYEEVVSRNIEVFHGLNIAVNFSNYVMPPINRASLRAIINGLADRTGLSTLTITIGSSALNKLGVEDIAIATAKNWTLA